MSIPFIDLQAQRRRIAAEIDQAVAAAVEGGQYVLGPQVRALEEQLKHASSAEKPGILKQIAALEKKRAKAEVALQKCRKTHPKP